VQHTQGKDMLFWCYFQANVNTPKYESNYENKLTWHRRPRQQSFRIAWCFIYRFLYPALVYSVWHTKPHSV